MSHCRKYYKNRSEQSVDFANQHKGGDKDVNGDGTECSTYPNGSITVLKMVTTAPILGPSLLIKIDISQQ